MKPHRINLLLVVASFAIVGALYGRMPETVPVHWNVRGEPDDWMARPWGPWLLPVTTVSLWLLFLILPRISPRGFRMERFERVYAILVTTMLGLFVVLTGVTALAQAGVPVRIDRVVPIAVGALLVVLGNFLGKVTKNFFVGIRTPWTLASDEVWLRTHRLGGKLFVLGGVTMIAGGAVAGGWVAAGALVAAIVLAGVVPVVYSFLIYRRIERLGPDGSENVP